MLERRKLLLIFWCSLAFITSLYIARTFCLKRRPLKSLQKLSLDLIQWHVFRVNYWPISLSHIFNRTFLVLTFQGSNNKWWALHLFILKDMPTSDSFSFIFVFSKYSTLKFSSQLDSNSDHRSRREGHWPLYRVLGPLILAFDLSPTVKRDYLFIELSMAGVFVGVGAIRVLFQSDLKRRKENFDWSTKNFDRAPILRRREFCSNDFKSETF